MKPFLIVQAVVSIVLVVFILLQQRGTDMGNGLSIEGAFSGGYHTKRGFERFLYYATVVLGVSFLILSILNVKFG